MRIHFDISVILVAPGAVESEIWDKGKTYIEKLRKTVKTEIAQLYAPLARFADKLNAELKKIPASKVALVVSYALQAKRPKSTYLVGKDANRAAKMSKLPSGLLDYLITKHIQTMGK